MTYINKTQIVGLGSGEEVKAYCINFTIFENKKKVRGREITKGGRSDSQ